MNLPKAYISMREFLDNLPRPQIFDFKDEVKEIGIKNVKKNELGFIAQDLEKIYPEVVLDITPEDKDIEDYKTINYQKLDKMLI